MSGLHLCEVVSVLGATRTGQREPLLLRSREPLPLQPQPTAWLETTCPSSTPRNLTPMDTWAGLGPACVQRVCACALVCFYLHLHPYSSLCPGPISHPHNVFKPCWDESEPGCPLPNRGSAVCHWSSPSLAFVICSKEDGSSSLWEQSEG